MKKLKKLLVALLVLAMATTGLTMPVSAEAETPWFDLEAEDGDNVLTATAMVDDNTYVYDVKNQADSDASTTVSFNAKEGAYDIWALVGLDNIPTPDTPRFGKYHFYLNDESTAFAIRENNNRNIEWIDGGLYTTTAHFAGYPLYMHWVKLGDAVDFDEGSSSITVKFKRSSVHTWCVLDKIRVVPTSWNHTPTDITTTPSEPVQIDVTGFEIEEDTLDLETNDHYNLTYEILPADATNKTINWSSSNANVAIVAGGTITARSEGTTTITGTTEDGGFTDTCVVNVTGEAVEEDNSGCAWLEAENAIIEGTGYTIADNINSSGGRIFQTQKSDADPITLTMIYEIEEAGEYAIKLLASESHPLHLTNYKVKLDGGEAAYVPSTTNGTVYNHAIAGTSLPTKWHDIATMNLAEGTHTIRIILDERRHLKDDMMLAFIDVVGVIPTEWDWDVTTAEKPQAPVAVEEIDIEETAIELRGGDTYTLSYDVAPANASVRDIVWSSSNANVAAVENGVVTALSGGTTIITAASTDGTAADTCEVTVLAAKVNSTLVKIANVTNTNQPGVGKNNGIVQVGSKQEEGTVYTFDIPFVAPEEGVYDIYFTGSESGVSHASQLAEYKLDGESRGMPSASLHFAKLGSANKADSTLGIFWYKLDQLEFDTEEHVLTFIIDSPRSLDGQYMFGLEYLLLVPKGTKLNLNAAGDGQAAQNLGEVLMTNVFIEDTVATKDLLPHKNTIDGRTITWTSSHPEIIDENGTVTRPGYYEEDAVVTLTATIEITKVNATVQVKKDFVITVPKSEKYTVKDFDISKSGSDYEATVRVSNNTVDAATAVLVLAHYNAEGAMVGIATDAIDLTNELLPLSTTLSGAEVAEGDTIEAFIWTDLGTKELIEESVIVYED